MIAPLSSPTPTELFHSTIRALDNCPTRGARNDRCMKRTPTAIGLTVAILAFVLAWPAHASATTGTPAWSWPVAGDRIVVRAFLAPASPYGPGHRGVDLVAGAPPLVSPADGVVRFAGMVAGRPVLSIDHGDGVISSYEPVDSALVAGTAVERGDELGHILDGHCALRCVHLGVRVDGEYANPMLWLGGGIQPILLPTRYPAAASTPAALTGRTLSTGRVEPRRQPRARAPATRTARR